MGTIPAGKTRTKSGTGFLGLPESYSLTWTLDGTGLDKFSVVSITIDYNNDATVDATLTKELPLLHACGCLPSLWSLSCRMHLWTETATSGSHLVSCHECAPLHGCSDRPESTQREIEIIVRL